MTRVSKKDVWFPCQRCSMVSDHEARCKNTAGVIMKYSVRAEHSDILYYTILYSTLLYSTLCYAILYYTMLCYTILYYIFRFHATLRVLFEVRCASLIESSEFLTLTPILSQTLTLTIPPTLWPTLSLMALDVPSSESLVGCVLQ